MTYLLGFWSQTYRVTVFNVGHLRSRSEEEAKKRKTIVSYFQVMDGRAVLLGTAKP
jgi:hypothetical protein